MTSGKQLTVAQDGTPAAMLVPLESPPLSARALMDWWSSLPLMDPGELRRDVDAILEQT